MRLNQAVCRAAAAVVGAAALLVGATLPSLPVAQEAVAGQRAASGVPADPASRSGLHAPALTPQVVAPRLAFTDDRDEVVEVEGEGPATTVMSGPRHVGEGSGFGSATVFVSTEHEPNGEIYVRRAGSTRVVRLTCNTTVETHPVLSPNGTKLAYASNESGSFQIRVDGYESQVPLDSDSSCPPVTRHQVTQTAGENVWPAWAANDELVFESTRADPLGDLYRVTIPDAPTPVADGDAIRLTDSPESETQPAVTPLDSLPSPTGGSPAVVFTTTKFRPDGSLGWIPLPGQGDATIPPVTSVWPDGEPRQSSEPALASRDQIAYTTTRDDPYGDVRAAPLSTDLRIDVAYDRVVAGEAGRAESHPGFREYTEQYGVTLTRAVHSADVSDVVAGDGSARRTVAAGVVVGDRVGPRDESTPAYSLDGDRIAYSRTADSGEREIVTANPDGSNVTVPEANRPAGSYDTEPAWSPDGTRIAFVRFPRVGEGTGNSEIWVVELSSGASRRVSTSALRRVYWDESPSWSPDGTRIVIGRTVEVLHPDVTVAMDSPASVVLGDTGQVTLRVSNTGNGPTDPAESLTLSSSTDPNGRPDFGLGTTDSRCVQDGGRLVCRLAVLAPGASTSIAATARAALGPKEAVLTVSADQVPDEVDITDNRASASVTVLPPPADVEVTVTAPATLNSGSQGSASVVVGNVGGSLAAGVQVAVTASEPMPPDQGSVTFASQMPTGCSRTSDIRVVCSVASVAPGATAYLAVGIVGDRLGFATVQANAGTVAGETNAGNNRASVRITVQSSPINLAPSLVSPDDLGTGFPVLLGFLWV